MNHPIIDALGCLMLVLSPLAIPLTAMAEQPQTALHSSAGRTEPAPLIDQVRRATERFRDIKTKLSIRK